jgi:hypothetical protein
MGDTRRKSKRQAIVRLLLTAMAISLLHGDELAKAIEATRIRMCDPKE